MPRYIHKLKNCSAKTPRQQWQSYTSYPGYQLSTLGYMAFPLLHVRCHLSFVLLTISHISYHSYFQKQMSSVLDRDIFQSNPSEDKDLFDERLAEILHGVLESQVSPAWSRHIMHRNESEWLAALQATIPDQVKQLLGQEDMPSMAGLHDIAWTPTDYFGVYGRLITELGTEESYVYVGSASGRHGLEGRKRQHVSTNIARREPGFHHSLMVESGRLRERRFVTLALIPANWSLMEAEELFELRVLAYIAEAVMGVFFGAFHSQKRGSDLRAISPFGDFPWEGACSHSPLQDPVKGLLSLRAVAAKQRNRPTGSAITLARIRRRHALPRIGVLMAR